MPPTLKGAVKLEPSVGLSPRLTKGKAGSQNSSYIPLGSTGQDCPELTLLSTRVR